MPGSLSSGNSLKSSDTSSGLPLPFWVQVNLAREVSELWLLVASFRFMRNWSGYEQTIAIWSIAWSRVAVVRQTYCGSVPVNGATCYAQTSTRGSRNIAMYEPSCRVDAGVKLEQM